MNSILSRKLANLRQRLPGACHRYGLVMMRLLARHCEFLATQRIRRASQVVLLYSKIWNESAIEKMVQRLRHEAGARGKMLLLGAALLRSQYDWDKERLAKLDLEALFAEFDETRSLLDSIELCHICGERKIFDKTVSWRTYCTCRHKNKCSRLELPHRWEAFLERSDVVILRRPLSTRNYEYRVFGKYRDVCAGAWFRINADDRRRKDWDDTCLEIRQIDQDELTGTHVLYWRSQYPFPMSNRDYVFKKNFILDRKRKMALIFNNDTVHPAVPETKDNVRIKRYRSVIVVRPETEFHEDGMEFTISYTDDPGVDLPELFISYVTVQGFPNYVDKMRTAARKLEKAVGREVMSFDNLISYFGLKEEEVEEEEVSEAEEPGSHPEDGGSRDGRDFAPSRVVDRLLNSKFRDPDSDVRKAVRILRELLGIKEKRPDCVENVVFTVGPSLRRYAVGGDPCGRPPSARSSPADEADKSPEPIETFGGTERFSDAGGGSAGAGGGGWHLTYWIPLSWLKRVVDVLPLYSSSMESGSRGGDGGGQ